MAYSFDEFYEDYAWQVFRFFEHMSSCLDSVMFDYSGGEGFIDDYLTHSTRAEAKKRVDKAIYQARIAWLYSFNGHHKDAIESFKKIFGGRFPSYG